MKKRLKPDYRRETVVLFEKINFSNQQLATQMGTSINTISRWRNGKSSPSHSDFEALKALASGSLATGKQEEGASNMEKKIDMLIAKIGVLEYRMELLEGKKKSNSEERKVS